MSADEQAQNAERAPRRGWRKALTAKPIDAGEYLSRVEQEDAYHLIRAAERIAKGVRAHTVDKAATPRSERGTACPKCSLTNVNPANVARFGHCAVCEDNHGGRHV